MGESNALVFFVVVERQHRLFAPHARGCAEGDYASSPRAPRARGHGLDRRFVDDVARFLTPLPVGDARAQAALCRRRPPV